MRTRSRRNVPFHASRLALFALAVLTGPQLLATESPLTGQTGPKPLTLAGTTYDSTPAAPGLTLGAPVVSYRREFAPVIEGLERKEVPATLSGAGLLATASGVIHIAAITADSNTFADMVTTPIDPAGVAVVHFGSMPMGRVRQVLKISGLTPVGEIPSNALVVTGLDPAARDHMERLGLRVLAWTPHFFASPAIGTSPVPTAEMAVDPTLRMQAAVFPGFDAGDVSQALTSMGASVADPINGILRFTIHIDALRAGLFTLTGLPIRTLAEAARFTSQDEDTNSGIQIGRFRGGDRPYVEAGIDGSGQLIAITDTGLSLDTAVLAHAADDPGIPGPGHRKVAAYVTANAFGGRGDLLTCDGVTGATHGHMVASIAAGRAEPILPDMRHVPGFEQATTGTYTALAVEGVAPGARIFFIDDQILAACTDAPLIAAQDPGILSAGLQASRTAGARIHNLSFAAAGSEGSYTLDAQDLDTFLVNNIDFLVVAAAGNSGVDSSGDGNLDFGTVSAPGTAKNALTVGASGYPNNTPDPEQGVVPYHENNGVGLIARFGQNRGSGQGPVAYPAGYRVKEFDWRIKPDVMAPGYEAPGNQRLPSPVSCVSGDSDQEGAVECLRPAADLLAGTSFAAAAASGAAALVRDYFTQGFAPAGVPGGPSVDLTGLEVKAALIASADLMRGNPAWRTLPGLLRLEFYSPKHLSTFTPEQGYGRIQLSKLLPLASEPGSPSYIHREMLSVPLAGTVTRTFSVTNPDEEARCVVSWYDKEATLAGPGQPGTLVRNVNLVVRECGAACGDADDIRYNGNFFTEDANFDRRLLQLDPVFACSNDHLLECTPGPSFDPLVECGDAQVTCEVVVPELSEDCNFNGVLDFSEFSLPVFTGDAPIDPETGQPRPGCPGDGVDASNNNEAVFLSPAQLDRRGLLQAEIAWPASTEGAPPSHLDVALVCTGGLTIATSPDTLRLNKGRYACADALDITAILPGGGAPAGLSAGVVLSSQSADGQPLDSESGLPFHSLTSSIFRSDDLAVVGSHSNPPAAGDRVLAVEDGGTITAIFGEAGASAVVRCAPQLTFDHITRRGTDAGFGVTGGCDPLGRVDPRAVVLGALPGTGSLLTGDLFLDAGEDLVYSMAFTSEEEDQTLRSVQATLKACVAGSIAGDGTCDEQTGITIHDPIQHVGAVPPGTSQTAAFNLHVSPEVSFPENQIQLVFGVTASLNGLPASSTTTIAHVLNQDRWSLPHEDPGVSGTSWYSTDFPTGGREIRVYAGEFYDPLNPYLAAEEFLFADLTDSSHGGGSASILGFNPATGRFDLPRPNNMPWTFDLDDEAFGARRRFDSDPGANMELAARNLWQWNNTGQCGFQSNDRATQDDWSPISQCSNAPTVACNPVGFDPLADCGSGSASCVPQASSGGIWHTGHAADMAGTPPGRTGYDLGCELYDVPVRSNSYPRYLTVLDTLSSPIFFRVHQDLDTNGFTYQVEFTRLGFNYQLDLSRTLVTSGYELDPDTTTGQPVDPLDYGWLASDEGASGFFSCCWGSREAVPYPVFNPNNPHDPTSVVATPGGVLDDSGSAANNIREIQGPGSPAPFYDPTNSRKAPARQFGEIQGLLTGRGMSSAFRRGAAGLPVRNFDMDLQGGAGQLSFEDIYGPNESLDAAQTYPICGPDHDACGQENPQILARRRDSYQANFALLVTNWIPSYTGSYGVGIDDVVVEWRESHPVADRTPCSDPSTWASDYQNGMPVGGPTTCLDGPRAGQTCASGADCYPGRCSSRLASGCAVISWDRGTIITPEDRLTLTVIDSNAQYGPDGVAGSGDEQALDSDGDGYAELTVPVNSDADLAGEQLVLTQISLASAVYRGSIAVSTTRGLTSGQDGTVFIQQNGDGGNPTAVNAFYSDADINVPGAGAPGVPCPDNPLRATALTRFTGTDISFVTATVEDVGPHADGDFIPDPGETIHMGLTLINNVVDTAGGKPDMRDIAVTLLARAQDVGPEQPIACILRGETFVGDLPSGLPRSTDHAAPFRWVVGDVERTSVGEILQAGFTLGISGHYTDSRGIDRLVTSFAAPQSFAVNLDLDVLPGGGMPVAGDATCVGGTRSGHPCSQDADCPGERFDAEGGGPRPATCDPLPAYLAAGGESSLAGRVGYFEGFEGAANMAGRQADFGASSMPGTSFEHKPALFPETGGYLEQFVRDTMGRGVLEGLTPGSVPGGGEDVPQGSSAVDGTRCQFNDVRGPGKWPNSEYFCRPWPGSDWHVNDNKAFTGAKSLYAGIDGQEDLELDDSYDGYHTNGLSAAFSDTFHVGVAGGASLSITHVISTADDRTFSVPYGNAVDRGYVEWSEVDPATGSPLSAWNKLDTYQNNYSSQGVIAFFTNCVFSSYDEFYDARAALGATPGFKEQATNQVGVTYNADDVASEDDYFDPNDPLRLYGPSNGCSPQFVFSAMGDYTGISNPTHGHEFTPGERGETGTGIWVKSLFSLDQAAGKTIRVRLVLTSIDIYPGGITWPDVFGNALGNATRGWRVDDVAISGLVDAPMTLAVDTRFPEGAPLDACPVDPDPGTPGNPAACNVVTARAGDDVLTPYSGAVTTLDATTSTADACVNGHLEYQWERGGTVLQPFSTVASLTTAPVLTTEYTVAVRCSTDPACLDRDRVLVTPADQLEASGDPDSLLEAELPSGAAMRLLATEPGAASSCALWMMRAPLRGGGMPDLRRTPTEGSAAALAQALRARMCTAGPMSRVESTPQHEFVAGEALAPGGISGYLAGAVCDGVIGSLGQVQEIGQGPRGARARLDPEATPACP